MGAKFIFNFGGLEELTVKRGSTYEITDPLHRLGFRGFYTASHYLGNSISVHLVVASKSAAVVNPVLFAITEINRKLIYKELGALDNKRYSKFKFILDLFKVRSMFHVTYNKTASILNKQAQQFDTNVAFIELDYTVSMQDVKYV